MKTRLTIKDIARLSGVGKSTVSRVLNNEDGVSPQTRKKVNAVMKEHGFSPSRSARAMRGQTDKVVAIIVTRLDSLSENLAVQTMLSQFYQQGYDPIMLESQFSIELVVEYLAMLKRRNVDGVILFGFSGIELEIVKEWRSSLVLISHYAADVPSVCYDDDGAIKQLMEFLVSKGHRNISYLGVPYLDITTGKRRHQSYLTFCQEKDLSPHFYLSGLAMKQAYLNAPHVINSETTAIVCASDTLALGVSKYLQEAGLEHIQLASVGNTPLMKFLHPEIISVDLGYDKAGLQAAQQLMKLVTQEQVTSQIIIPSKLAV